MAVIENGSRFLCPNFIKEVSMDKILKLIINNYQNQKPSAEYKLILNQVCEAEERFLSTLSKEQKVEYRKLEFIVAELDVIERDEFAEYLFDFMSRLHTFKQRFV